MKKINPESLGSRIAKNGFKNEKDIVKKFNNWQNDAEAKDWIRELGHDPKEVSLVKARHLTAGSEGHWSKRDIEVSVQTFAGVFVESISIKLVSSSSGSNQVDKRWVDTYAEMWGMPGKVTTLFKEFTGDTLPTIKNDGNNKRPYFTDVYPNRRKIRATITTIPAESYIESKLPRKGAKFKTRTYFSEMNEHDQESVISFLEQKKDLILSDIFQGRSQNAPKWMMVAHKVVLNNKWIIKPMKDVIEYYGKDDIKITRRGLRIGRVNAQRKGGDSGRDTANQLQFKIDPTKVFYI